MHMKTTYCHEGPRKLFFSDALLTKARCQVSCMISINTVDYEAFHISEGPDQMVLSQASWTGSTVFSKIKDKFDFKRIRV